MPGTRTSSKSANAANGPTMDQLVDIATRFYLTGQSQIEIARSAGLDGPQRALAVIRHPVLQRGQDFVTASIGGGALLKKAGEFERPTRKRLVHRQRHGRNLLAGLQGKEGGAVEAGIASQHDEAVASGNHRARVVRRERDAAERDLAVRADLRLGFRDDLDQVGMIELPGHAA